MNLKIDKHPSSWQDLVVQMIAATKEAITDASLQKKHLHTAVKGRHEKVGGPSSRYSFTLQDDWEPGVNTRVQILLDPTDSKRDIAGTVLSTINKRIILITEIPLPQSALATITLCDATIWLLERLCEALIRLQEGGETSSHMAAKVFDLLPCKEGRGARRATFTTFLPDADQEKALTLGLGSERLLLIGPPGTGKTSTESALAVEYLLAEETVFLLAHTNVALDSAITRVAQYCEQSGNLTWLKEYRLVRLGTSTNLEGELARHITLQGIVDEHLGRLPQERDQLRQEKSDLEERVASLIRELASRKAQWLQRQQELQKHLKAIQRECGSLEAREQVRQKAITTRLETLKRERETVKIQKTTAERNVQMSTDALTVQRETHQRCENALMSKTDELTAFHSRSPAGRLWSRLSGITEQTLEAELEQHRTQLLTVKKAVTALEQHRNTASQHLFEIETHLHLLNQEIQQLLNEQVRLTEDARQLLKLNIQCTEDERQIQAGDAEMKAAEADMTITQQHHRQIIARLEAIEEVQGQEAAHVLGHARLIGATLTGLTTNPHLRERLFGAVLIDEASMASLAHMLVAASHATKHVGLFGDPNQLVPIIHLTDKRVRPLAAYWLGTDLFSHLKVTLTDADAGRKQTVLLSQQSRMLPEIAAPVSQFIYGGRLKNRLTSQRIPLRLEPHPEWPLILLDTSDGNRENHEDEEQDYETKRPRVVRQSIMRTT